MVEIARIFPDSENLQNSPETDFKDGGDQKVLPDQSVSSSNSPEKYKDGGDEGSIETRQLTFFYNCE